MFKIAAILTSAAIACSGAACAQQDSAACRIAAARCGRPSAIVAQCPDSLRPNNGCQIGIWGEDGMFDNSCGSQKHKHCFRNGCTIDPDAPAIDPDAPAVDPDEPAIDPDEPAIDPDEPVVNPDKPVIDPDQPAIDPDKPVVDPDEPAIDPDKPVVDPDEPAIDPDKPVVDPDQPGDNPVNQDPSISAYAQEVVRLVNIEREKAGLSALKMDAQLSQAAQKRAVEISSSFAHTRPDGSSCFTVLKEYGIAYRASGENIAKGQTTPERVVTGWMNSEGHRKNILNANFTTIGVGYYVDNMGTAHWSQLFTA